MTSQQILQTDLLDILFEHRNKAYGAYQLRKTYSQQLIKAVAVSISVAIVALLLFKPSYSESAVAQNEKVVVLTDVVMPPEPKTPEPPKTPETPKTELRQQNFTENLAMKQIVTDPLPPLDEVAKSVISNVTTTGEDAVNLQPALPQPKEPEKAAAQPEPEKPKEIVPDRQPQFPGGSGAWADFLRANLRVPEDLESGEKRTAVIRFHVAEDGSVTAFQVIQSAGNAFDNEVIRVLKKMPKWTPATKAGQPVSVSFTQPVTFVGMEE
jgi:periplasmic protein TonB